MSLERQLTLGERGFISASALSPERENELFAVKEELWQDSQSHWLEPPETDPFSPPDHGVFEDEPATVREPKESRRLLLGGKQRLKKKKVVQLAKCFPEVYTSVPGREKKLLATKKGTSFKNNIIVSSSGSGYSG